MPNELVRVLLSAPGGGSIFAGRSAAERSEAKAGVSIKMKVRSKAAIRGIDIQGSMIRYSGPALPSLSKGMVVGGGCQPGALAGFAMNSKQAKWEAEEVAPLAKQEGGSSPRRTSSGRRVLERDRQPVSEEKMKRISFE